MRQHDLAAVVDELLLIGRAWAGDLPGSNIDDRSNYRRLRGAQSGVLAAIDGDGPSPLRLSPKERPTVDLDVQGLHGMYAYQVEDRDQRRLLTRLERVWEAHQSPRRPISMERLMGRYLTAICCVLAAHYRIHLLELDDDGETVGLGDDIAPDLPAAFATAWHDLHRPTLPLEGLTPQTPTNWAFALATTTS